MQKHYSAYKPSGTEWLGDVPSHWEVQRVKWIAELNPSWSSKRSCLAADTPVTFLPMEKVGTEGQIDTSEKLRASQVWNGYTCFRRGDILVAKITPCFENGKGAYLNSLPTEVGFGSTEFHVLRATQSIDPRFLYLLTTDIAFRQCGTESMTGAAGQKRVSADFVANYQVPLPPLAEQHAIAAFLDRETAKIDALVSKKERLTELLQEKRTALISHTVTKGLDPNAAMKDSGIEWLGEIPAHWEVKRLKYLATVNDETLPESTAPNKEITYVDIGNVDSVKGITGTEDLIFENAPSRARRVVRQGDVIISTVRTYLKAIARIESKNSNLVVSTGFAVVRPRQLDAGFVAYALGSPYFVERVVAHSVGVSYPAINASELAWLDIAFPPIPEQTTIAAFLERETAKLDSLISKVREAIELLKELRTVIISSAVTGQIDVREETECM